MRSVNKVILIGNLTRDPELRQTPNGQTVVTFSVATNREWMTRDGRRQSLSEFHDVVAWANLAEVCQKYLKKSKLVYIEGYLKTRSWDTPEGIKRFKTEIVVQDMIMLDKRNENTDQMDYIPEEAEGGSYGSNTSPESATSKKRNPVSSPTLGEAESKKIETKPSESVEKSNPPVTENTSEKNPSPPSTTPKSIGIDDDLGL